MTTWNKPAQHGRTTTRDVSRQTPVIAIATTGTIKETVMTTWSEMEELFIELDTMLQHSFGASAMAVADEAGDVWYGTRCYASSYQDHAQ